MKNKLLYIVIQIFLISCSPNNKEKTTESIQVIENDTILLKTIKWDSLNENIQYYFLRNGNKRTSTYICYSLKLIARYHYLESNYELQEKDTGTILDPKPDTGTILNSEQLKEFIRTDFFKDKNDFECLLKVNSKIGLNSRPDLLHWFLIFPANSTDENLKKLMSELNKEKFTKSTKLITKKSNISSGETKFIRVNLKPAYLGLSFRKQIEDTISHKYEKIDLRWADFYTGYNEQDLFYRITSAIE